MSGQVSDTLNEKILAACDDLKVDPDEAIKVLRYHGIIDAIEAPLLNERDGSPSREDVQRLRQEVLTMSNDRMDQMDRICEKTSNATDEVQRKISALEQSFQKNKGEISEVRSEVKRDIANCRSEAASTKESLARELTTAKSHVVEKVQSSVRETVCEELETIRAFIRDSSNRSDQLENRLTSDMQNLENQLIGDFEKLKGSLEISAQYADSSIEKQSNLLEWIKYGVATWIGVISLFGIAFGYFGFQNLNDLNKGIAKKQTSLEARFETQKKNLERAVQHAEGVAAAAKQQTIQLTSAGYSCRKSSVADLLREFDSVRSLMTSRPKASEHNLCESKLDQIDNKLAVLINDVRQTEGNWEQVGDGLGVGFKKEMEEYHQAVSSLQELSCGFRLWLENARLRGKVRFTELSSLEQVFNEIISVQSQINRIEPANFLSAQIKRLSLSTGYFVIGDIKRKRFRITGDEKEIGIAQTFFEKAYQLEPSLGAAYGSHAYCIMEEYGAKTNDVDLSELSDSECRSFLVKLKNCAELFKDSMAKSRDQKIFGVSYNNLADCNLKIAWLEYNAGNEEAVQVSLAKAGEAIRNGMVTQRIPQDLLMTHAEILTMKCLAAEDKKRLGIAKEVQQTIGRARQLGAQVGSWFWETPYMECLLADNPELKKVIAGEKELVQ